jgi:hypothetical protein
MPSRRIPDPSKTIAAGPAFRFQYGSNLGAKREVGKPDDGCTRAKMPVEPRGRLSRNSVHEFDFANRAHLFRTGFAVHGPALRENARHHIVAGNDVREIFGKEVALARPIPKMMVSIDDRLIRIQHLLGP